MHEELDHAHGSCVLRHAKARAVLADAFVFFDAKRLWLGDLVIMPNHCHALVLPLGGWELEDLLGSIKKWSSRRIGGWLGEQAAAMRPKQRLDRTPRFWQEESYDRIVRDTEELAAFRSYIAGNASGADLPPEAYAYHAAEWLDAVAPRPKAP